MKEYRIVDVCVEEQSRSPVNYVDVLDKPIDKSTFVKCLMLEIDAYTECYNSAEEVKKQFMQNMTELITGGPVQINGMEFSIREVKEN